MNLWVINHEFPPLGGGGATACEALVRRMAARGQAMTVFTAAWRGLPQREKKDGYEIIRVSSRRKREDRSTPWEMISFIRKATAAVSEETRNALPDATLSFFTFPSGVVARNLKRKTGVPYLVSVRGHDVPGFLPHRYGWYHRILLPLFHSVWREASSVVANSRSLEERVRHAARGISLLHIPNGIDSVYFRANGKSNKGNGHARLLFVGRLTEQKGLAYLLKALSMLKKHPFSLRVVGDGELRISLEQEASRLGLQSSVTFVGRLPREEILSEYQQADLFILPSLDEGMSNVLLEAMACGLPMIATAVGDNTTLVESGRNGLLVPAGDERALTEALQKLLRDPEARRSMGEESRRRAMGWTWEAVTDHYLQLLNEAKQCQKN